MDNYLSHRWPDGKRPAGEEWRFAATATQEPKKKRRRVWPVLLCLVLLAGLAAGAYFGIMALADYMANQLDGPVSLPQQSSTPSPDLPQGTWTSDILLWGDPDPSVRLTLEERGGAALPAQEIYQNVLPSIVCVRGAKGSVYSVGSGVIVTDQGHIITNYHVIEDAMALQVMLLSDQSTYRAKLIGFDQELDLAVLKIDAEGLSPARLGDSDLLHVGDAVYAIGNPMGYLYGTMTDGIVSSLTRESDVTNYTIPMIQVSAALNTGNSGGALVNDEGQVVGITTAKITGIQDDTVVEGLGLAIPVTDILPFLNHILATGDTCRPSLGIMCYAYQQDDAAGIMVDSVTPDTPAAQQLQAGDLIVAANGIPVTTTYELTRILYATGVGNGVELSVVRGEETLTLTISLYDRLN